MDSLIEETYALSSDGQYGAALIKVQGALAQRPHDAELLFARASVLFDWGRISEACAGFLQAEAAGAGRLALYLNLAWSHLLLGSPHDAEPQIRKALAAEPHSVPSLFCQATILQALNRHMEAIAAFEAVIALAPERSDCLASISACHFAQGAFTEAEATARQGIAIAPDRPAHWVNLGMALAQQDRFVEALAALKRAGEIEVTTGENVESFVSEAYWLLWSGHPDDALRLCRSNLPLQPSPNGHGQYAFALLTAGQYREGWDQYEYRWFQEPLLSKRTPWRRPVWAGQELAGKTILLRAEQGAGDTIQFARYAASFKAMGAAVILQVQSELRQLAGGFAGVDHVIALAEAEPRFDYYLHLMGAPHALRTEIATVPADVPYLSADTQGAGQWAAQLPGPALNVGLAWAGSPGHLRDRHRSMPLDALRRLWDITGVNFVSLQKQLQSDEADQLSRAGIRNLGAEFADFSDTAAAIAHLDLVICVDTAIGHLAGAMGKTVWLLLPEAADFRWLRGRDDSPWYPTMRLFRQQHLGEWDEVIGRVSAGLVDAVGQGSLRTELRSRAGSQPPVAATTVRAAAISARSSDVAEDAEVFARVVEARDGIVQFLPDADDASRSVAWYGEFLQPQLDLLGRLLRPGGVVLEAGSDIGIHALGLASIVGATGHLLLYESRPMVRRLLQQNLAANGVVRGATLMRHSLRAAVESDPADALTALPTMPESRDGGGSETIDDLLLDRLDLLKVSGVAALDVLSGAGDTLWRLRPMLFLAIPDASSIAAIAAKVGEFAYRCWQMETPCFHPDNFNGRDRDIFAGRTAWALLAIPEEIAVEIDFPGCVEWTASSASSAPDPMAPHDVERGAAGPPTPEAPKVGLLGRFRKLLS